MIKRIIYILLLSSPLLAFSQQALYNIAFRDIQNNEVSLNSFSGKKVVIAVINGAAPEELFLKKLDTLYRNNSAVLQVIAVPVSDFGTPVSNESLLAIYNRLNLGFIMTRAGKGKKTNGDHQLSLLQWLTHSDANKRFDNDVEEPGQLFVISETGLLYAVMKSKVSPTGATMNKVISQKVN